MRSAMVFAALAVLTPASPASAACPFDQSCLNNPYGAGSPYKRDGLMNPFSRNGSPYSPNSWTNPYASDPPRLYDSQGNYRGKLSANPYDPESVSNPYGRYGSPTSPDSIKNPYGAGNPYSRDRIQIRPAGEPAPDARAGRAAASSDSRASSSRLRWKPQR